jgi:hypothetical protein
VKNRGGDCCPRRRGGFGNAGGLSLGGVGIRREDMITMSLSSVRSMIAPKACVSLLPS